MDGDQSPVIVEGLAALAQTIFEMGGGSVQARGTLVEYWVRLGCPPGAFLAAAHAIKGLLSPAEESALETERTEPVRAMLGVTSAEQSLVAALAAREALETLARELG